MSGIDKGSASAWKTRALIEAWYTNDAAAFEQAFNNIREDIGTVVWNLIAIAGGVVQAIANASHRPFEEALPSIWMQLSQNDGGDETAQTMRMMVTAWHNGEEMASAVNRSGILASTPPDELIMNFLGVILMLARSLTKALDGNLDDALEGFWLALGTEGPAR